MPPEIVYFNKFYLANTAQEDGWILDLDPQKYSKLKITKQ